MSASSPNPDLLSRLDGVKKTDGGNPHGGLAMSAARGRMLVERLGLKINGVEGHDLKGPCVNCESSDAFRVHADTGVCHCYSCQYKASPFSLAEKVLGDRGEAIKLLVELGMMEDRGSGSGQPVQVDPIEAVARLKSCSVGGLKAYGATAVNGKVAVPMYDADGGQCSTFTLDPKGGKGLCAKGKPTGIFLPGGRLPAPGERWGLVEGVKDASVLWTDFDLPTVGMNGNALAAKFSRIFADVEVVIVPDRDAAAENGAKKTAALLYDCASSTKRASLPAPFTKSHGSDVRDVLKMKDGKALIAKALLNARVVGPEAPAPAGFPLSDSGLAERFAQQHTGDVHYCFPWGKWLTWDGRRWGIDATGRLQQLAKQTARSILKEAAEESDRDRCKELAAFALRSESLIRRRAMLQLAQSEPGIPILPGALDRDSWLLNCGNGTLNLRTGRLREHRRDEYITKVAPVEYDAKAKCPTWLQFLADIFHGNSELVGFVQRLLGYCLTGDVSEQVLPIFWGTGCNGKSTLIGTILDTLGEDYAIKAPNDFLLAKKTEHPTERADLHGKRVVACVETGEGRRLAEELVKDLTGGDKIRARRMREDYWQFDPTHKAILGTNHRPEVRGTDWAIWRRIRLVPFTVTIPDDDQDRRMPEKLRGELPGILAWCFRGCITWQKDGLQAPKEVTAATAAYRQEQDLLAGFLADCCIQAPGVRTKAGDLLEAYRNWAGDKRMTQRRLATALRDKEFDRKPSGGHIWWWGVELTEGHDLL